MQSPILLNPESLPATAHILVPSRLNADELSIIIQQASSRSLVLLAKEDATLDSAVQSVAESQKVIRFNDEVSGLSELLGDTGIAVFLPSRVTTLNGNPMDIAADTVESICAAGITLAPCCRASYC